MTDMLQPSAPQAAEPAGTPTPSPPRKGSGLAVTSLVLGIVALLLAFVPIINNVAFVLALLGLVFGLVGWTGARKGKRTGRGMAVAGIVLALVAGTGVIASQAFYVSVLNDVEKSLDAASEDVDKWSGSATEKVLAEDLRVTIGEFRASEDELGLVESSLTVTLTNKADKPLSYDVVVEALDAEGTRIADDTGYAQSLKPGQSTEVSLFELVDDKTATRLEAATFEVAEASSY